MDTQASNIEIANQYIQQVNDRFLVEDEPYDNETKKYNVGTFYIHRGMGKGGVEYSVREVLDENGAFKVHGKEGMLSDQVCYYLEGFLQGHFDTCELLGYELADVEATDATKPTAEGETEEGDDNVISLDDGEEKAEG